MVYRVARRFVVESGHQLWRHPEACRFPHGHTRTIEVVVAGDRLDGDGMLVDFKALKLALAAICDRYDHALAIAADDPGLPDYQARYPAEGLVVMDGQPTTERIAETLFHEVAAVLERGFAEGPYRIGPGALRLERLRVSETRDTWAEVEA